MCILCSAVEVVRWLRGCRLNHLDGGGVSLENGRVWLLLVVGSMSALMSLPLLTAYIYVCGLARDSKVAWCCRRWRCTRRRHLQSWGLASGTRFSQAGRSHETISKLCVVSAAGFFPNTVCMSSYYGVVGLRDGRRVFRVRSPPRGCREANGGAPKG